MYAYLNIWCLLLYLLNTYVCIFKQGILGLVLFNYKYLKLDGKSLAKKFGVKYVETSPGKQGWKPFSYHFKKQNVRVRI